MRWGLVGVMIAGCANAGHAPSPAASEVARAELERPSRSVPDPRGVGDYPRGGEAPAGTPSQLEVRNDPPSTRSLSTSEIEAVLRVHAREIHARCWLGLEGGGGGEPSTQGQASVRVSIDGAGRVTEAVAEPAGVVGACLAKEIRGWAFPAKDGATGPVEIPFRFVGRETRTGVMEDPRETDLPY